MDLRCMFMCLVALLLGFPQCQTDDTNRYNTSTSKYCGKRLSQTLSTVCKGNYNTLNKKSDIYDQNNFWDAQFTSDVQKDSEYPFKSKASATSLITSFRRRRRRGVFNECCQKPCSHEELASYCGSRRK